MRGAKGGFWDRLFARIRQRKIIKRQKQNLLKEKNILKKKIEFKKKNDELQVLFVHNNTFNTKPQKRKFKLHKKNIVDKNIIIKNNNKFEVKNIVIKKEEVSKPKFKISKKGINTRNEIYKNKNSNKKSKKNSKILIKTISDITSKSSIKKKKGISNKKVSIPNNKEKLDEKTSKLIKELNKIIDDNRNKINEITLELQELKHDLNEARTIKKVEEIEKKVQELKRKLIELIENYSKIKDGNIISLKDAGIKDLIEDINKLDPNFKIDEIINKVTPNLDYYNEMSNAAIESVNIIHSSSYRKDIIDYKNNEEYNMNVELSDFNSLNNRLSKELDKNKNIIKEFNILINKISPKKIVKVQSDFLATMLHNTGCLIGTFLSIPFLKKPKNIPLFTFGLFTINNSIRSMRKVTTTETINYIPSNDYANQIIKYRNSFSFVDYMISDSLYQISELKEEYKINFSSYHNTQEFEKNLRKIESMEDKLLKQSKNIQELKNKYQSTLDKNYDKVLSIKNNK